MKGKIPRNLAHDIQQNIKNGTEIECKIRFPDSNSSEHYDLALSHFDGRKGWKKTSSHYVDIHRKGKRFTRIGDKYFNTSKLSPSVLQVG